MDWEKLDSCGWSVAGEETRYMRSNKKNE